MLKLPTPVSEFASGLLRWYRRRGRDLPWRRDPTPYRVWLSEVMLQQTQVKTVLPYFERFLKTYPSLGDLARADPAEALSLWAGLGYYSRARNLLRAARAIDQRHGGVFPSDYQAALQLPGVGRYTAGAVLSIAYGKPLPILDGNIRRLFSRYLRLDGDPASHERGLWRLLEELAADPAVAPEISDFNQALMEIGALVCTPRRPSCPECPLEGACLARRSGLVDQLPRARPKPVVRTLEFVAAVIVREGRHLMKESSGEPFPRGFREFPRILGKPGPDLRARFLEIHQVDLEPGQPLAPVGHRITHHKLIFHPVPCRLRKEPSGPDWTWTAIEPGDVPVSTYVKKILRRLG